MQSQTRGIALGRCSGVPELPRLPSRTMDGWLSTLDFWLAKTERQQSAWPTRQGEAGRWWRRMSSTRATSWSKRKEQAPVQELSTTPPPPDSVQIFVRCVVHAVARSGNPCSSIEVVENWNSRYTERRVRLAPFSYYRAQIGLGQNLLASEIRTSEFAHYIRIWYDMFWSILCLTSPSREIWGKRRRAVKTF